MASSGAERNRGQWKGLSSRSSYYMERQGREVIGIARRVMEQRGVEVSGLEGFINYRLEGN